MTVAAVTVSRVTDIARELADLIASSAAPLEDLGVTVDAPMAQVRSIARRVDAGDAETCLAVHTLARGGSAHPPAEWSATALGAAVTVGMWPDDRPVPLARAAVMLRVSRPRVQQLRATGVLDAVEGGVTIESVRARRAARQTI